MSLLGGRQRNGKDPRRGADGRRGKGERGAASGSTARPCGAPTRLCAAPRPPRARRAAAPAQRRARRVRGAPYRPPARGTRGGRRGGRARRGRRDLRVPRAAGNGNAPFVPILEMAAQRRHAAGRPRDRAIRAQRGASGCFAGTPRRGARARGRARTWAGPPPNATPPHSVRSRAGAERARWRRTPSPRASQRRRAGAAGRLRLSLPSPRRTWTGRAWTRTPSSAIATSSSREWKRAIEIAEKKLALGTAPPALRRRRRRPNGGRAAGARTRAAARAPAPPASRRENGADCRHARRSTLKNATTDPDERPAASEVTVRSARICRGRSPHVDADGGGEGGGRRGSAAERDLRRGGGGGESGRVGTRRGRLGRLRHRLRVASESGAGARDAHERPPTPFDGARSRALVAAGHFATPPKERGGTAQLASRTERDGWGDVGW